MSAAASDFARAADPAQVFREGVRDANGRPVDPQPWQERIMRSEAPRHLILCNRQAGKSTTVGAKASHGMIYAPGLYLIIAPTLRQSKLLFQKVASTYRQLQDVPRVTSDTSIELVLENDSRLVALPGDNDANIRGFSAPRAVIIDEAARVSDSVYAALRPMLAASTDGQLIALSTPYGRRGWFFDAYDSGKPEWERTKITVYDCPHIPAEFIEKERNNLSTWQFRSELMSEFTDTDEAFFSSELIDAMIDNTIEPLIWTK